jgi:hypothetical protein
MTQVSTRQFGQVDVDFQNIKPPKKGQDQDPLNHRVVCYNAGAKRVGCVRLKDLPSEVIPAWLFRQLGIRN